MKKLLTILLVLTLTLSLVACGGAQTTTTTANDAATTEAAGSADDNVITVGASSTPHAEILEQVKDALAAEGYTLNIVTYDDWTPTTSSTPPT